MTKEASDISLLSRAATVSYLMGIGILVFLSIVFLFISNSSFYILTMYQGPIPPPTPAILFSTGMIMTLIAVFASTFLNALFGRYNYRIGKSYGVPTLRRAGTAGIIVSLLSLVLIPLQFGPFDLTYLGGSSPSFLILLIPFYLVILFVTLEFYVMLYRGLGGMQEKTGIKDFETARTMWLVSIVTGITMPMAMILYGNALRKMIRQNQGAPAEPRIAQPPELQINYCTHCGARIEPGARFCLVCGSPTKYENE